MSLSLPNWIKKTGIIDAPITYSWDDSDPETAYVFLDERLQHRIGRTSDRGVLAVSLGFAEWVAWRLSKHTDVSALLDRIEATWAAMVDWRYMKPWRAGNSKDWRGPARGPLWAAMDMLHRVIDLTMREQFAFPESVCLSYLVLHVLPEPAPFKDWRRFVIQRLAMFYPRDLTNPLGPPIPRDVLDPEFDYRPELAAQLLSSFLKRLDPTANPYLRSPSEMTEAGFDGTPYTITPPSPAN